MEIQEVDTTTVATKQEIGDEVEFKVITPEILRELMKKKKKNIQQVSREAKIKYSTLYYWATGQSKPNSGNNLKKLGLYFGVSTDYLLYGIGDDGDGEVA